MLKSVGVKSGLGRGRRSGRQGLTLVEVLIAMVVIAIGIGSVFMLNSQALLVVKAVQQGARSDYHLRGRLEQIRIANWTDVTDGQKIQTKIFNSLGRSLSSELPDMTETLTISAYPAEESDQKIVVQRRANNVTILQDSDSLSNEVRTVRVDYRMMWEESGRSRVKSVTALISRGGVQQTNLASVTNPVGNSGGGTTTGGTTTGGTTTGGTTTGGTTTGGTTTGGTTTGGTTTGGTTTGNNGNSGNNGNGGGNNKEPGGSKKPVGKP